MTGGLDPFICRNENLPNPRDTGCQKVAPEMWNPGESAPAKYGEGQTRDRACGTGVHGKRPERPGQRIFLRVALTLSGPSLLVLIQYESKLWSSEENLSVQRKESQAPIGFPNLPDVGNCRGEIGHFAQALGATVKRHGCGVLPFMEESLSSGSLARGTCGTKRTWG